MAFVTHRWEAVRRELFDGPSKSLATIATLVSLTSGLVALARMPFA